ncbi:hypothetical protein Btru_044598 [Bulinus truncatus]|nr:hypothetical protein Btru_044598 [Bulinus truncatus]
MIEFCHRCGILLPLKNVNDVLCKGCENENQLQHSKTKCNCDYCGRLVGEIMSPLSDSLAKDSSSSETIITDLTFHSDNSRLSLKPNNLDVCHSTINVYTVNENTGTFSLDNDADRQLGGFKKIKLHEQEELFKDIVNVDINKQWEREQAQYKEQLILEDTKDISDLTSGKRRKADGSRFYIGGVDISFIKGNNVDACASLCVVRMPDLELVYQKMEMIQLTQPYISGFLAFREVPPLLKLLDDLKTRAPQYFPDVLLIDGNGILHPRGFGLACHLGVLAHVPTVGVAKTLISAQGIIDDQNHRNKKLKLKEAGDGFELISDTGETLGMCLRVHDKAPNPIYVSVGHMISLKSSVWLALECSKYRIPEPVRRADIDSREYIRQAKTEPYEFIAI